MSLNIKGRTCAACHAYLFEDDDVVFCPICGAPHHRDCYANIGHCALEEFHGTDKQYNLIADKQSEQKSDDKAQKAEEKTCRFCNKTIEGDAKVCPYCGRPLMPIVMGYDFLGGVNENTEIDGVKATEIRDFVAVNTHKYLPRFTKVSKETRLSWNWTAFLFPEGWFFSRKMYKQGAIVLTLMVVAQILTIPLFTFLSSISLGSTAEYAQYLLSNISEVGVLPIVLSVCAVLLAITTRVLSALYGTYIYKKYVLDKIKAYTPSKEDRFIYNRKYGGVNILMFLAGVMILNYLPQLLFMFV